MHSLHILAHLRAYSPGATSVLMDTATYTHHAGPIPTQGMPDLLIPSEVRLYQLLLATPAKNHLEQEHLYYEYTGRILQDTLA